MTSEGPDIVQGDEYYLPFWVLLDYLGTARCDAFIKVKVIETKVMNNIYDGQLKHVNCCDIECVPSKHVPTSFTAHNIPSEYLIKPAELQQWAAKISCWFADYAKK